MITLFEMSPHTATPTWRALSLVVRNAPPPTDAENDNHIDPVAIAERRPIVLVVDDEHDIRETLAEVLEFEGYEVLQACDGREGLAIVRQLGATPFVVLLDMKMPVMDGEEFLRTLRDEHLLSFVPVVVLSASMPRHEATSGARICLHKPISYDALVRVVGGLRAEGGARGG